MTTITRSSHKTTTQPKTRTPLVSQNFLARYLTALVFIPVGIVGMFIGGALWALMMALLAVVAGLEFFALARGRPVQGVARAGVPAILGVLLAFYLNQPLIGVGAVIAALVYALAICIGRGLTMEAVRWKIGTTLAGVAYIGLPIGMLIGVSQFENHFVWLVVVMAITWGTDTFAYFGGRMWGKRKLAPRLSPKKTVEGAVVGVVGGWIPALLFLTVGGQFSGLALVMILVGPLFAIVGDLLESAIKRFFEVKDSHLHGFNVLPGHGGVMDRIDSLVLVTAFCFVFIALTGIAG